MKKPSTTLSALPVGAPDMGTSEQIVVAPGKSFFDLLFPKRTFRQHRPKSFRAFWGAVLDSNPALRSVPDKRNLSMSRKEFKKALQEAFYAGQGMTASEAAEKMEASK